MLLTDNAEHEARDVSTPDVAIDLTKQMTEDEHINACKQDYAVSLFINDVSSSLCPSLTVEYTQTFNCLFHSRLRSTYAYDLLTGRFRRRFPQSAFLPRIKLVHCAVVMHIYPFYMFVHTCFHHSFTHFHFKYSTECVLVSSSHIICSALCVCCSVSLSLSLLRCRHKQR